MLKRCVVALGAAAFVGGTVAFIEWHINPNRALWDQPGTLLGICLAFVQTFAFYPMWRRR